MRRKRGKLDRLRAGGVDLYIRRRRRNYRSKGLGGDGIAYASAVSAEFVSGQRINEHTSLLGTSFPVISQRGMVVSHRTRLFAFT